MARFSVSNGQLLFDGRGSAELGYNAYSLGQKAWLSSDYAFRADFPILKSLGVRTVRIMCAPVQGSDWNTLIGNPIPANWAAVPATYRGIVEEMFDKAAANDIAIVACLHWNYQCIPDLLSETYANAFLTGSASITYWKAWATLFVNQFKNHAGLGMWQIGNEWPMLQVTNYGDGAPYSGHSADRVIAVVGEIADTIRAADSNTPIASGSIGAPTYILPNRIVTRVAPEFVVSWAPGACNVAEAHLYMHNAWVGSDWTGSRNANCNTMTEMLAAYKRRAGEAGKAFMVGGFGVSGDDETAPNTVFYRQMIVAMRSAGIGCALAWNWNDSAGAQDKWNIYPGYSYSGAPRGNAYISALSTLASSQPSGGEADVTSPVYPIQRQCASFSGASGGEITVPASSAYNTYMMSLSFWVRARATSAFSGIARYRAAANDKGWVCLFNGSGVKPFMDFRKGGPASANNSAGIVDDWVPGVWYHFAFSFSNPAGSTYVRRIWVNGFQWHYLAGADSGYVPNDGTTSLFIGSLGAAAFSAIDVADVCLSDAIFTDAEVMNLYKYQIAPTLVGRWKLDGNALDSVGTNHGSAGGGVTYSNVRPTSRSIGAVSLTARPVSALPVASRREVVV